MHCDMKWSSLLLDANKAAAAASFTGFASQKRPIWKQVLWKHGLPWTLLRLPTTILTSFEAFSGVKHIAFHTIKLIFSSRLPRKLGILLIGWFCESQHGPNMSRRGLSAAARLWSGHTSSISFCTDRHHQLASCSSNLDETETRNGSHRGAWCSASSRRSHGTPGPVWPHAGLSLRDTESRKVDRFSDLHNLRRFLISEARPKVWNFMISYFFSNFQLLFTVNSRKFNESSGTLALTFAYWPYLA